MTRGRSLVAVGAGVALALTVVLAGATAAWAHDRLVASDPAAGSTVTSLEQVTLTFSASLLGPEDQTANLIQVTGPDGAHYETACATVTGPVVTVPVAPGAAGAYEVDWRVVSSDGHPVSGSYTFTYAPGAVGSTAAPGSSASACAAIAAAASSGSDASTAGDDSGTAGLVIGLAVGGALVVVIAVVLVLVLRRGSSSRVDDDEDEDAPDQSGG